MRALRSAATRFGYGAGACCAAAAGKHADMGGRGLFRFASRDHGTELGDKVQSTACYGSAASGYARGFRARSTQTSGGFKQSKGRKSSADRCSLWYVPILGKPRREKQKSSFYNGGNAPLTFFMAVPKHRRSIRGGMRKCLRRTQHNKKRVL